MPVNSYKTYLCEFELEFNEFLEELLFKFWLLLDDEFVFLFVPFLFLFIIFHPFIKYLLKAMIYSEQEKAYYEFCVKQKYENHKILVNFCNFFNLKQKT